MRYGLLSDVHSNLAALQAVLHALHDRNVDGLLVAGDIVGYGAQPNECIELLASVGAICVAGNHDLFVLDRLPPTRFPRLARRSAELTRAALSAQARTYLEALPISADVDTIHMTHGSPSTPEEYVLKVDRAQELLHLLPDYAPNADTLLLGHTHQQRCVLATTGELPAHGVVELPTQSRMINPGSVGQSRDRERIPTAQCAIYDSDLSAIEFLRLQYDLASSRAALHALGLPERCMYAPPRARDRALRRTRALARLIFPRASKRQ